MASSAEEDYIESTFAVAEHQDDEHGQEKNDEGQEENDEGQKEDDEGEEEGDEGEEEDDEGEEVDGEGEEVDGEGEEVDGEGDDDDHDQGEEQVIFLKYLLLIFIYIIIFITFVGSSSRQRRGKNKNIALSRRPPGSKVPLTFRAKDGRPTGKSRKTWSRHLGLAVRQSDIIPHHLLKWEGLSADQVDVLWKLLKVIH